MRTLAPIVCASGLATGCDSIQMAASWQLDRLRVLGVRAEPAEPRPGEPTTFTPLVFLPADTTLDGVIWFACLPESADDFGCTLDPSLLTDLQGVDPSTLSPEELAALLQEAQDAGLIGFSPFWDPVWTPPADALDGMDEWQQLEGLSAIINLSAVPAGAAGEADVEIAYKRVPVSLASTPNHNPDILAMTIDGQQPDELFHGERGKTYNLAPVLAPDAIETYTYIYDDESQEERAEEPYFTWYTEGGSFDQSYSLYPYTDVDWTAPDGPWSGLVVTVMRDRRGGMAWGSLSIEVD